MNASWPPGAALERVSLRGRAASGAMPVAFLRPERPSGRVALIAHGRNGGPDQPQMRPVAEACLARGDIVVLPQLCNSAAEGSTGRPEAFTMAGHLADMAVVLAWAGASFFRGRPARILLAGHSMGAYGALRLAAERPEGVEGVIAISPVVSGARVLRARERMGEQALASLSREVPAAVTEWPRHDLMPLAPGLTVPVAIVTGADDTVTPPEDARALARALPNVARLDIVPGAHHCPVGAAYRAALEMALDRIAAREGAR